MADTQIKTGFTPIDNDLFNRIFQFSFTFTDLAVIFITLRYTLGYRRKHSGISLSKYANLIRSDRSAISRSLQRLIRANVIKVILPESGPHPRVLELNDNYSQWDKSIVAAEERSFSPENVPVSDGSVLQAEQQSVQHSLQQKECSEEQPFASVAEQPSGLSVERPHLKKEEKKLKESNNSGSSSSSNFIYLISEEEIKNTTAAAAALNELDERLKELFKSCLLYQPNSYELKAVKKEIFSDDRFEKSEILKIIQESFHKVATYVPQKKNTSYVIGVIKSEKQELFLKREEEKKQEEKLNAYSRQQKNEQEYIPGSILGAYEKEMRERKNELKKMNRENNKPGEL